MTWHYVVVLRWCSPASTRRRGLAGLVALTSRSGGARSQHTDITLAISGWVQVVGDQKAVQFAVLFEPPDQP